MTKEESQVAETLNVLDLVGDIKWERIARTFGNCHSTFIGAVVQQWNAQGCGYYALEPGCSSGFKKGNVGTKICDAILCRGEAACPVPIGVLEVESNPFPTHTLKNGEKAPDIFHRLEIYWTPAAEKKEYFDKLCSALLIVYDYATRKGGAVSPSYDPDAKMKLIEEGQALVLRTKRRMRLCIAIVHKVHPGKLADGLPKHSIRKVNSYYPCTISKVEATEVLPGVSREWKVCYERGDGGE